MKKLPFLCGFLLFLMSIVGCRPTNHQALLQRADSLLAAHSKDVALALEQLEEHSSEFSEEELMHYVWLRADFHSRVGISMTEDTLLPKAIDYFCKRGDGSKTMEGCILKAKYLKWKDKNDDAIAVLDSGIVQAEMRKDSFYASRLLYSKALLIYEYRRDYAEVARYMKRALPYCSDTVSSYIGEMTYFLAINLGLINDESSSYYYEKSISIAEACKDTAFLCHYLRNYASNLMGTDKAAQSNALIRRVWELRPEYRDRLSITQMILAENFLHLRKPDSASYYINIAWQNAREQEKEYGVNISERIALYELQNVINYALGRSISTIPGGRFGDSLVLANSKRHSTMQQQMETKMKLERQNYTLIIDRQRMQLFLLATLFIGLSGGLFVFFYIRKRRFRLAEAEDRIETLTRLLEDADKSNSSEAGSTFFKKILLQQLGIIRLVATAPTSQNQELLRRISGITNKEVPVESLLVWEDLYPVIDSIYDGFYTRMNEKHGNLLSEKEKQTCCLLCADFSTKEIGVVTQQSVASVYVRKTAIRKKLGMDEKENIVSYINNSSR